MEENVAKLAKIRVGCRLVVEHHGIVQSKLELTTSKKGKLEYRICIDTDHETFEKLKKRYEIMLS